MRILIVNDDSISAPVLPHLATWAKKLGDVTVVVPKYEQSGKSHGIEIHKSFSLEQVDLVALTSQIWEDLEIYLKASLEVVVLQEEEMDQQRVLI